MGRAREGPVGLIPWLLSQAAAGADEAACTFLVDDAPVERLDCEAGGAWKVRCPLPETPSGKVRVKLSTLGIEAEARLPLAEKGEVRLPLGGPGGRSGAFLVDRPVAGMLPGQALGPNQLCPYVQPDVPPGSPRAERTMTVEVTIHQQTGFVEEPMDGGVVNRVPTYDAGVRFATGSVPVLMRKVGDIPVLTGTTGLPKDEPVKGHLQLADATGTWRSLGWSGRDAEVPLATSVLRLLVLDFVAPEVATVTGKEPLGWIEEDLERWLSADPSSLLGRAAFGKSGLHVPLEGSFEDAVVDGMSWRRLKTDRAEIRIGRQGDRLRVGIAWQGPPFDAEAREAVQAAFTAEL